MLTYCEMMHCTGNCVRDKMQISITSFPTYDFADGLPDTRYGSETNENIFGVRLRRYARPRAHAGIRRPRTLRASSLYFSLLRGVLICKAEVESSVSFSTAEVEQTQPSVYTFHTVRRVGPSNSR